MTETEFELPTQVVAEEAREALRPLSDVVGEREFDNVLVRAQRGTDQVEAKVPRAAYRLLLEALAQLSRGQCSHYRADTP